MDPVYIRCKDRKPRIPYAFQRLHEAPMSTNPNSIVLDWVDQASPKLPLIQRPQRHPLPETQSVAANPSSSLAKRRKQVQSYDTRVMTEENTILKRGRGRPRGARTRGGRGRGNDPVRNPVLPLWVDESNPSPDKEMAVEESKHGSDPAPTLVLRPAEASSSASRRSPTRSPARGKTAADKKGDLALLTPAIRFVSHERATERGGLPQVVQDIWANHIFQTLNRSAIIPLSLKARLTAVVDTPRKSKLGLKPDIFDSTDVFDDLDLELIWMTLSDVSYMADQYRNSAPESHWVGTVVAPLLHLLRRLSIFKNAEDRNRPLLEVLDMATTEISPRSLCPYSDNQSLFRDLDKRIDYAVGLRISAGERDSLERGLFAEGYPPSINQTSSFANFTPLFINIEVKRRHVDRDPMIQLAAWVAAEFNKRKAEGYSLDMPVFAIAIDGDLWELYIAYSERHMAMDDYLLNFLGPFDIGHTKSYHGMFQILNMLCCLARWGVREYREWVVQEILALYRTSS